MHLSSLKILSVLEIFKMTSFLFARKCICARNLFHFRLEYNPFFRNSHQFENKFLARKSKILDFRLENIIQTRNNTQALPCKILVSVCLLNSTKKEQIIFIGHLCSKIPLTLIDFKYSKHIF